MPFPHGDLSINQDLIGIVENPIQDRLGNGAALIRIWMEPFIPVPRLVLCAEDHGSLIKIFYEIPHVTGFLIFDSIITGNWTIAADALRHIILPCITIALYPIGLVARMTRSAMLEILNEDYITAVRSYGISERRVHWRYALKNSLGATATVVTLSIGSTLVNTFLVEAIFDWPGIGSYISNAVTTLDYPAVMGVTLFSALSYVILNLISDIIIALDPRIRV